MKSPVPPQGRTDLARAHWALFIICLANALSVADRTVVQLLLEPIKHDLQASDTEMSLLTGASFILFYTLFGIPIALWADRGNRRNILSLGVAVWSLMTAVCGGVQTFWQMAAARAAVGAGEAAGTPTSVSLITDLYPPRMRARMMSFFQLAVSGGGLAFSPLIGVLADGYGWRAPFIALGVLGIVVTLLVRFTVREPERGGHDEVRHDPQKLSFREALAIMGTSKPFVLIMVGTAMTGLGIGVIIGWGAAVAMRTFHVSATEVGTVFAPILGIAAIAGALSGGFLTSWTVERFKDQRWMVALPAVAAVVNIVAGLIFVFAPSWPMMIFGGALGTFSNAFRMGPYLALCMSYVPANCRAMAGAVNVIATSLIGQACGPLVVGIISDMLEPTMGARDALHTAFMFSPIMLFLGVFPFFMILRHYDRNGPIVRPVAAQ